jgi:hypothetical protein
MVSARVVEMIPFAIQLEMLSAVTMLMQAVRTVAPFWEVQLSP